MPRHDRFLRSRTRLHGGATLGRVFSVVQETWRMADNPRKVKPQEIEIATRRTAADAADLTREAASAYERHGFHKPSGAWWGSDGEFFHRFVVAARRRNRTPALLVGLGVAALAITALGAARRSRRDRPAEG